MVRQVGLAINAPFGTPADRAALADRLGLREVKTDPFQGTLDDGGAGQCYWYFEDGLVVGLSWVQPPPVGLPSERSWPAAENTFPLAEQVFATRFGPSTASPVGLERRLGEKLLVLRAPDDDEVVVTLCLTAYRSEFFDED